MRVFFRHSNTRKQISDLNKFRKYINTLFKRLKILYHLFYLIFLQLITRINNTD